MSATSSRLSTVQKQDEVGRKRQREEKVSPPNKRAKPSAEVRRQQKSHPFENLKRPLTMVRGANDDESEQQQQQQQQRSNKRLSLPTAHPSLNRLQSSLAVPTTVRTRKEKTKAATDLFADVTSDEDSDDLKSHCASDSRTKKQQQTRHSLGGDYRNCAQRKAFTLKKDKNVDKSTEVIDLDMEDKKATKDHDDKRRENHVTTPKSSKVYNSKGHKEIAVHIRKLQHTDNILILGETVTYMKDLRFENDSMIMKISDVFMTKFGKPSWPILSLHKQGITRSIQCFDSSQKECFAIEYRKVLQSIDITHFDPEAANRNFIVFCNTSTTTKFRGLREFLQGDKHETRSATELTEILGYDPYESRSKSIEEMRKIVQEAHRLATNSFYEETLFSEVRPRIPKISRSEPSPRYLSPQKTTRVSKKKNVILDDDDYDQMPIENVKIKRKTPRVPKSTLLFSKYNIDITQGDLERLDDGEFLNDNIIDFWLNELMESKFKHRKGLVLSLSTHFYPVLMKEVDRCAERVVGKEKLFKTELVFLPVCEGAHWVVYILYNMASLGKENSDSMIMYCDSLGSAENNSIVKQIRELVSKRYKIENPTEKPLVIDEETLPCREARLPVQNNYCDCGVYLLQYVEEIITRYFNYRENTLDDSKEFVFPVDGPNLFTSSVIQEKRKVIRKRIIEMTKAIPKTTTNTSTVTTDAPPAGDSDDSDDLILLSQDPAPRKKPSDNDCIEMN